MYKLKVLPSCEREIRRFVSKDRELKKALERKLKQILRNPEAFKPLRGLLAGLRRVHVKKSFVLIFKVEKDSVILVKFAHHDEAYKI